MPSPPLRGERQAKRPRGAADEPYRQHRPTAGEDAHASGRRLPRGGGAEVPWPVFARRPPPPSLCLLPANPSWYPS